MKFGGLAMDGLRLHYDFPSHLRMHTAIKRILPGLGEAKLKFLVSVECGGFELAIRAVHGVRNVVLVGPSHLSTGLDSHLRWLKDKVIDLDFGDGTRRLSGGGYLNQPQEAPRFVRG